MVAIQVALYTGRRNSKDTIARVEIVGEVIVVMIDDVIGQGEVKQTPLDSI